MAGLEDLFEVMHDDDPEYDDNEDHYAPVPLDPPRSLNTTDYTLDNPLIIDEVNAVYRGSRGETISHHLKTRHISGAIRIFGRLPGYRPKDPASFHRYFGSKMQQTYKSSKFSNLLETCDVDSRNTWRAPKAFLKSWLGHAPEYEPRLSMDRSVQSYGALFYELHRTVIAVNALTQEEVEGLGQGYSSSMSDDVLVVIYKSPILGTVTCAMGFCYIADDRQLLDRNMLLMWKDCSGGRFQVLAEISYRMRGSRRLRREFMAELFSIGDKILEDKGAKGYNILKLVEAISSDHMNTLSSKSNPLFPKMSRFTDHVSAAVGELAKDCPLARRLMTHIRSTTVEDDAIGAYGAYRLWGHPFVDYMTGLTDLYNNTHLPKNIDTKYAECLASDLAYMMLRREYKKHGLWRVDLEQLKEDHVLYEYVKSQTWPHDSFITRFGDKWHTLPLTPCFDIPEMIDPSVIYADKSHSMDYSEVAQHIKAGTPGPIPSRKVLISMLTNPLTNIREFLQAINDVGLTIEDLIIGLRCKERELKEKGRFFALMSRKLREYFVITEYLLKKDVIPLFGGLTMADDLNQVVGKMWASSAGQSPLEKNSITIANSIDYSKWNNHQRGDANNPVFKVLGQFYGMPNLFTRTHEFFESSLIYYKARPDLLTVRDGEIMNKGEARMCWKGQPGGLEGLRQKGWSIVNYLCIEREATTLSTAVKALAQGDNQIISTFYKVDGSHADRDLIQAYQGIVTNNDTIMQRIRNGTSKLGLIINEDETMQSYCMLIYGKVVIANGLFYSLTGKRVSRVLGNTNDQFPNMGSIHASVVTNILTICHYSEDCLESVINYNWLGNFSRILTEEYNPAMRGPMKKFLPATPDHRLEYNIRFLYLDPALGGVSGISVSRMIVRQFPDPVTEGLCFWKRVYEHGDSLLRKIAIRAGSPKVMNYRETHFEKLLENPAGLNLPHGVSVLATIQRRIRVSLKQWAPSIKNQLLRDAILNHDIGHSQFLTLLRGIKPCFPRFLSEFRAGTYVGLVRGYLGLFENARTIKTQFAGGLGKDLDQIVYRAELSSIAALAGDSSFKSGSMWSCSSTKADSLRTTGWNQIIVGATVPHPLELIGTICSDTADCKECLRASIHSAHVKVQIPGGILSSGRGLFRPYLGSKTSETTSLVQPWEKSAKIPILRTALHARSAIGWFVAPESRLAKIILANIASLSGEEPGTVPEGFKRTGSALHRFKCGRQSNGGFSANSPNLASFMFISTDALHVLGDQNYDFMHQALIVYAQATAAHLARRVGTRQCFHFHIACQDCLREVKDPSLEASTDYVFQDHHVEVAKWKPQSAPWFETRPIPHLIQGKWEDLSGAEMSYHIGRIQSFYYLDRHTMMDPNSVGDLFPNSLRYKLHPIPYIEGLMDGVLRSAATTLTSRYKLTRGAGVWDLLHGAVLSHLATLGRCNPLLTLLEVPDYMEVLTSRSHRVPSSYPASKEDLSGIVTSYFSAHFNANQRMGQYSPRYPDIWIFSEFLEERSIGPLVLAGKMLELIMSSDKKFSDAWRVLSSDYRSFKAGEGSTNSLPPGSKVRLCSAEVRAAAKSIDTPPPPIARPTEQFGLEYAGPVDHVPVMFTGAKSELIIQDIPRISCPLIAGLRLPQLATGSPLKLRSILKAFSLTYTDFLCGGDGSGGWTSALLRFNVSSRGIFNSLFHGSDVTFRGTDPLPPSAIWSLKSVRDRCVNATVCADMPSDLGEWDTWIQFGRLVSKHKMKIDLIALDMEMTDDATSDRIENHLVDWIESEKLSPIVIYKTYIRRLMTEENPLTRLVRVGLVRLVQPEISGSHTSEIYILCTPRTGSIAPYEKWPDYDGIQEWVSSRYCFRTPTEELARAVSIRPSDTLQGVPPELIPDLRSEWTALITGLGASPAICSSIAAVLFQAGENCLETIWAVMTVVANQLIPFYTSKPRGDVVPSDQKVNKMTAVLMGVSYWWAYLTRSAILCGSLNVYNGRGLAMSLGVVPVDKSGYTNRWSYIKDYKIRKTVSLLSHQALEAQTIRLCMRMQETDFTPFDQKRYKRDLSSLGIRVSYKWIASHTGVFDLVGPTKAIGGAPDRLYEMVVE